MLDGVAATAMPHPEFTISQGSHIPCLLYEDINSSPRRIRDVSSRFADWVTSTNNDHFRTSNPGREARSLAKLSRECRRGSKGLVSSSPASARPRDNFQIQDCRARYRRRWAHQVLPGNLQTFFWEKAGAVALYALIEGAQNAISCGSAGACPRQWRRISNRSAQPWRRRNGCQRRWQSRKHRSCKARSTSRQC